MNIKQFQHYSELEHLDALIAMIQSQMAAIDAKRNHKDFDAILQKVLRPEARTVLFVLEEAGGVLGFSFCNICSGLESGGDYLWINEIYIDPKARRKGYGALLLKHMETWSLEEDIQFMSCVTDHNNLSSQNLFRRQGFELDSILWMDKALSHQS